MEQIKNKRHRLNLNAFILCFISVIFAGVATYTIANSDNKGGGKGKANDDNNSFSSTSKPIADITVHQPPLQLAVTTQTKPIVRVINKNGNNAQEDNNDKQEKGVDNNKKIFDVPDGMLKGDINVDGDWKTSAQGDVFVYKQDFMGFPFVGSALFKQGVAKNAVLTLEKFFSEYIWWNNEYGKTKRNIEGEEGAPNVYCFGDRYKTFVGRLIKDYGSSVGNPTVDDEDISSSLDHLSGWCEKMASAKCSKNGDVRRVTREFKDDAGNNIIIFTAYSKSIYRDYSFLKLGGTNNYSFCKWTISLK